MVKPNEALAKLAAESLERKDRRKWAEASDGSPNDFRTAVAMVFRVISEQKLELFRENGVGNNLLIVLNCFGDYFSTMTPSDVELSRVIELSKTDYNADKVLALLAQISRKFPYPLLADWESNRYAGLTSPPPKPPGPDRFKNNHRNMLIVGQIRELQSYGFNPSRNIASSAKISGCDVLVEALDRAGTAMSYDAIWAIWKNRLKGCQPNALSEFFREALGI